MSGSHTQCCKSIEKIKNVVVRTAGVDGSQKKVLHSLELVLQVVVNHLTRVLRIKFRSLEKVMYTLTYSAKSLASRPDNSFAIIIFTLRKKAILHIFVK